MPQLDDDPGAPDAPPPAPPPHPRPSPPTLCKHVLGRCRFLICTLPPVEIASIFCQVAVDMAYEHHFEVECSGTSTSTNGARSRWGRRCNGGISVLRMVTLNNFDRLASMGLSACCGNSFGSYSAAGGVGRRQAGGERGQHQPMYTNEWTYRTTALRCANESRPVLPNKELRPLFLNCVRPPDPSRPVWVRVELSGQLGGMGSPPRVPHGGDGRKELS
ncbi:hypothetical protein B0H14DRAFT_3881216 [Mycena olivaceomarginata]|nr:hypothetical protein B0H14DRAFT_3881216 [Mycena olivaceomarginata]